MASSFTWCTEPLLDEEAAAELGVTTRFPSQQAAEAWFTEHWADLDDAGVEAVTLLDGDVVVYGPMPLTA